MGEARPVAFLDAKSPQCGDLACLMGRLLSPIPDFAISCVREHCRLRQSPDVLFVAKGQTRPAALVAPYLISSVSDRRGLWVNRGLASCSPTSLPTSPQEINLHNRHLNQLHPAPPRGPTLSRLACRVSAKLLLPTQSKMIQTMKTHPTSRMSFVPITQKWAVLSLHGYRQIRKSLL